MEDIQEEKEKESTPVRVEQFSIEIRDEDQTQIILLQSQNSMRNGIHSIVGALIIKIGLGSIFVIFNLSTYLISYLIIYGEDKSLTLQHTYFFDPLLSVAMAAFLPFVGMIEYKIGLKPSIILGTAINLIGCIFLYFSTNFYFDLFSIFFYSIGTVIGKITAIKNVSMYFFNKRGTISGILELITSFFTGIYNSIGETIVNPKPEEVEENGFYSENVAKNIKKFFVFQFGVFLISAILGLILIVPYNNDAAEKLRKLLKKKEIQSMRRKTNYGGQKVTNEGKGKKEKLIPDEEKEQEQEMKRVEKETKYEVNDDNENNNGLDENIEEEKDKDDLNIMEKTAIAGNVSVLGMTFTQENRGEHIKKAIKSKRVLRLFLMTLFNFPINNLIMMTWRPIAIKKGINIGIIQRIGNLTFYMSGIANPLFGFLADRVQYRILHIILAGISSLCGFFFCFSLNYPYLFLVIVNTMNFIKSSFIQVCPPHYMKVFGMRYFIEVSGVIGLSGAVLSPLCSIFAFFAEKYIENLDLAYQIVFIGSAGLNLISVVLALFETEEPFNYFSS